MSNKKTITFDGYQSIAKTTAEYPPEKAVDYLIKGLISEVGEIAAILKRIDRGDEVEDEETVVDIKHELGDCLWYISELARAYGIDLSNVAESNINKLRIRAFHGVIKGKGDYR